jgi:hypothetical protein
VFLVQFVVEGLGLRYPEYPEDRRRIPRSHYEGVKASLSFLRQAWRTRFCGQEFEAHDARSVDAVRSDPERAVELRRRTQLSALDLAERERAAEEMFFQAIALFRRDTARKTGSRHRARPGTRVGWGLDWACSIASVR